MAHYAELNENNEVIYVVYVDNKIITDDEGEEDEQLGINHLHFHHGSDRKWVRTSYTGSFRGKYAGIGDTYLEGLGMFVCRKPYPSWIFNKITGEWVAPLPQPEITEEQKDKNQYYFWSEEEYESNSNGWVLTTHEEFT